ncbi:hypothetical protein PVT67_15490 [Gallaecimonas kandeliae]|uniref:hypothetical protein n=1 Tax=Gallaecimonas kandeliae TaxID=3029055 RepID=UPI0026499015|nr:hypothetical protein [Gallaecimonas kandeliae]WKE65046.1 hypothetical protein PVT67_15490 [Gallaecimonas kandeliae]
MGTISSAMRDLVTPQNALVAEQLACASSAARRLMKAGITVLNVELGRQRPVIEIAKPPKDRVRGTAVGVTCRQSGQLRNLKVCDLDGCRIQWEEERA